MTEPLDPLFFSTFIYSACKVTGATPAQILAFEQERGLAKSEWPCFRTLAEACAVAECKVFVDGSTYITRARSVAAGHFLRKAGAPCDVWLTCDDDMFAPEVVLRQLVLAARETHGLVALPYLNRDGGSMTFRKVSAPTVWVRGSEGPDAIAKHGIPLRSVDRVGMGLVAMHRDFVQALDYVVPHFEDDYPAMFLEGVTDVDRHTGIGTWTGEDFWLCALAEKEGLPMYVLLNAPSDHAGRRAMLDVDGVIQVAGKEQLAQLEEGLARAAERRGSLAPSADVKENDHHG